MDPPHFRNGALNGSFLILDLESNTLGLGNSFVFPTPHQAHHANPIKKTPHLKNASGNADTGSTSTNETYAVSERQKSKRASEESEDPDWMPQKKVRRSRSSASHAAKSNTSEMIGKNPSEILLGEHNGAFSPGLGSPPQYLVNLLNLFGWRVVLQPGFSDYIYISPAGLAYYNLPKAFETFLEGTSKYKEKPWSLSQFRENREVCGTPEQVSPVNNQVLQTGTASEGPQKKERRPKMKNSTSQEIKETALPTQNPCQQEGSFSYKNNEKLSNKAGKNISQVMNQVEPSFKVNTPVENRGLVNKPDQITGINVVATADVQPHKASMQNIKFLGPRRSTLLRGRDICVDSHLTEAENLNLSPIRVNGDMVNDKAEMLTSTSQGEISLCEVSEPAMINEPANIRKSSSSCNDVRNDDQENVYVETNIFAEKIVRNSLRMPKSASSSGLGSNMHCSDDLQGIRRSVRIKGKHVCVDDELDADIWFFDDFCDIPQFAANGVVKDKQKLDASFCGVDSVAGRNSASYALLVNQTNVKKSGFKRSTIGHPGNHDSKNTVKLKRQRSEKCSHSKDIQVEISVAENCLSSSAANREPVVGGTSSPKGTKSRNRGLTVRSNLRDNCCVASKTKLTMLSWLINSGIISEYEKAAFISNNTSNIPTGMVTRGGIWCDCCKKLMSLSEFATHSDSKICHPWNNIYLMSGKTFMQCLKEACKKEKKYNKVGFQAIETNDLDPSDDTCGVCADGGKLICCDGCPSTFHQECVMLKDFPEGSWYCAYCRCAFCMMTEHRSDMGSEILSLFTCKQCRRKYHQKCAQENSHEMGSLLSSFCGYSCMKLAARLSDLLGVSTPMKGGFSWTLLKFFHEDESITSNEGLSFALECNVKLSMALFVMNECFMPLMDQRTGLDIISQAVYSRGSNFNRLNYEGFYTLILEKDEEVISVASLRFLGKDLAEMPFVGTRPLYRRQGMCHRLLQAAQDVKDEGENWCHGEVANISRAPHKILFNLRTTAMLSLLSMENLIIPAIPDLLETWMKSFSFKHLESPLRDEIRNLSMVTFPETTLLQKSIRNSGDDGRINKSTVSQAEGIEVSHEQWNSWSDHSCIGYMADNEEWLYHEYKTFGSKDVLLKPGSSIV